MISNSEIKYRRADGTVVAVYSPDNPPPKL